MKVLDISQVKEFAIEQAARYVRRDVAIDRSSSRIVHLNSNKNPEFKDETLFLMVLVEGKANLYQYVDGNLIRYFFSTEDVQVEQLIYKKYLSSQGDALENNTYLQQLWVDVRCDELKEAQLQRTDYTQRDLVQHFTDFNLCNNGPSDNYVEQLRRKWFHMSLRPRINVNALSINYIPSDQLDMEFPSKIGFSAGLEFEFTLPFNKNKWAITVEPTYQYYKASISKDVNTVVGGKLLADMNYQSVELPLGLRYYMFLSEQSRIYINAAIIYDFEFDSDISLDRADGSRLNTLNLDASYNLAFGAGYAMKRISVELRAQSNRPLLALYNNYKSKYSTFTMILGYKFF